MLPVVGSLGVRSIHKVCVTSAASNEDHQLGNYAYLLKKPGEPEEARSTVVKPFGRHVVPVPVMLNCGPQKAIGTAVWNFSRDRGYIYISPTICINMIMINIDDDDNGDARYLLAHQSAQSVHSRVALMDQIRDSEVLVVGSISSALGRTSSKIVVL